MSNELSVVRETQLKLWEDLDKLKEIRAIFAPKLSDLEFQFFVGIGKASGLNPFLRELWAVKYQENTPAQIFVGRDGYRKAAQRHHDYEYHTCDAVYSNDTFKYNVRDGYPDHEYNLKDRGELLGAYCIVKRKSSSRPSYTFVKLSEYSTGKSLWNNATGKPETMIKKVSEAQGLRATFQDLLGGTYGEEEYQEEPKASLSTKSDLLMDKLKAAKGKIIGPIDITPEHEEEPGEEETGEVATEGQLKELHKLIAAKRFNNGRLTKAMNHYGIETLAELTKQQAMDFMAKLHKIEVE